MFVRIVTRAAEVGASATVVAALVAGVGIPAANADPVVESTDAGETAPAETTSVRLKVGNQQVQRIETDANRPRGLLARAEVKVDGNDLVKVVRSGRVVSSRDRRVLRDRDLVKVVRVKRGVRVHKVRKNHPTRTRSVTSLSPGTRKVARSGRHGLRRVRVKLEWHNGDRVSREVHRSWIRRPKPRVVLVGKRQPGVSGTGHLNWAALARCESGGNPRAVNSAGYYGLYQFSVGTWRSVGGSGMPHLASSAEQTYRAKRLYSGRGRSPWPHCGRYL